MVSLIQHGIQNDIRYVINFLKHTAFNLVHQLVIEYIQSYYVKYVGVRFQSRYWNKGSYC
jgi:hypothetical protein